MKRIFIAAQFILLFVILGGVLWSVFKPAQRPDYNRAEWSSWKGFFVLSYQGVSKKDGAEYVSAKQLGKQLEALKKAGFHTITPKDVAEFLDGRTPLPAKAVLLLFEGGRKDSFVYAAPHLINNRFFGVMCVPAKLANAPGTFYLNQRDLTKLTGQENWRLCSMGSRAIDTVPVDARGAQGHFLTSFIWTSHGLEDKTSFAERVRRDYEEASSILEKATGTKVEAYLYPFSDTGVRGGAQSLAARVNLESLKRFHRIAFTRADNPFNGPESNPYDLNRLRVPASWDASRLVAELEKYSPRETAVDGTLRPEEYSAMGEIKNLPEGIKMGADSLAWVRGTDDWKDLHVRARVNMASHTTVSLYGRYGSVGSYVRLSINSKGLRLQEHLGGQMQTLASYAAAIDTSQGHDIELRIKGNRAWANFDGKLIAGPVPVAGITSRGRIGFGSQQGEALFARVSVHRIRSYWAFLKASRILPKEIRDETGAILTTWFKDTAIPALGSAQVRELLLDASEGIVTVPVVDAPSLSSVGQKGLEPFVNGIVNALSNPLVRPLIKYIAVRSPDENLCSALRSKGYRIIRLVSAGEGGKLDFDISTLHALDKVLVEGREDNVLTAVTTLLHSIPDNRILYPAGKKTGLAPDAGVGIYLGQI